MLTIRERLNNPGIVRVYLQLIRNDHEDIVKDLRKTLKEKAEGHKGEEKGVASMAKKIASGKMSPQAYAKKEASEPMKKGGRAKKKK